MSIFRNTFTDTIKTQLGKRQEAMAMTNRTPDVIQYLNSRNSWVRMCSSVNINGSAATAKNYVLLGGTLTKSSKNFSLKSGIGDTKNNAYSTVTPNGGNNRLGIRPMPGITSVDVKSKSAYGSLREAVVNFQCWDIRQLEDLELLYMRPGYTVLVEWGWLPYLDNSGGLNANLPRFYDILDKPQTNRTQLFKDLYEKTKSYDSNYDAMFGYVKNYQWSARADGGYDCQTTIISTGEIVESLKLNYVFPNLSKLTVKDTSGDGFLNDEFSSQGNSSPSSYKQHYDKNTLAGVWAELYDKLRPENPSVLQPTSVLKENNYPFHIPAFKSINTNSSENLAPNSDLEIYITLRAAFDIITNYVVPKSETDKKPLVNISVDSSTYGGSGGPLLCVAHPLQVSVDPSVCLIKSPLWYDQKEGILVAVGEAVGGSKVVQTTKTISAGLSSSLATFLEGGWGSDRQKGLALFEKAILQIPDVVTYGIVEKFLGKSIQDILNDKNQIGNIIISYYTNMFDHINKVIGRGATPPILTYTTEDITTTVAVPGGVGTSSTSTFLKTVTINITQSTANQGVIQLATSPQDIVTSLKFLEKLQQPYFSGDVKGCDELGIIGNIYVNLGFLYKLALDPNIESQDKQEKNEISLVRYLKNMMSAIQASIGNINNFEIHVDPVDNKIARVIDINYTGDKGTNTYNSLFTLETHNLKSTVRSYTMQSQIFPEQGAMIAIGSQAQGGQLGMQNNTMIDFNKTITDRIIQEKIYPGSGQKEPETNPPVIANNLGGILYLLGSLAASGSAPVSGSGNVDPNAASNFDALFNGAKNNLRDLIVGFQSVTNAPGANRNIIPIKFSFEMDGIGGLVIGHLFKLNSGILPKGYKGGAGGHGAQLAQTITGIGHTITNNDWVTKIEALNIVLDDNKNKKDFCKLDLKDIIQKSLEVALAQGIGVALGGNPPTFGNVPGAGSGVTTGAGLDKLATVADSKIDFSTFTYPIGGSIASGIDIRFGGTNKHRALDISGPAGDQIYSVCEGTVAVAGTIQGFGDHCIYVLIDRAKYYPNAPKGTNWYAVYGHSRAMYVKVGDKVVNGQHIADRGSEGHSDGPHLHFQIQNTTADDDTAGALSVNISSYFPASGQQLTISSAKDVWK